MPKVIWPGECGGAVVQMSSVGGQITASGFGAYCATKFALEGLTQTLSQEVDFGVTFLIVEPGAFRTGLFNPGAAYTSAPMPEYAATVGPTREYLRSGDGTQPGDPAKAAQVTSSGTNPSHGSVHNCTSMPSRSGAPRPRPGSTNATSPAAGVKYRISSSLLTSGNERSCSS
jgi:NAD(P)-dependent dehydrogenase (short-subunit alcohol dehydrogenase family)